LQIKSKLLAGDPGSEPRRRIYFPATSPVPLLAAGHFCLTTPCGCRGDGRAFREPTGSSKQHSRGGKANLPVSGDERLGADHVQQRNFIVSIGNIFRRVCDRPTDEKKSTREEGQLGMFDVQIVTVAYVDTEWDKWGSFK
jgi:hypothetical protein